MRKGISRVGAIALALVLTTSTIMPVMAKSGYSTGDVANSEAVKDALANADIIDYSKKASLTIRKYDMTAASEIGGLSAIDTEGTNFSSGEQNTEAERSFEKYEVAGVEFTYANIGNIETSSKAKESGTGSDVKVVYEIDAELRTILGLDETEPEDMTADNEANPCTNEGKFHYTASVLQDALRATNAKGVESKDKLEAYAVKHGTAMPLTDKDGLTRAENLNLGLYLVVETKVPEQVTSTVDPWIMSLPSTHTDGGSWFYDVYAYPKNQTGNPTLEKLVRNATGSNATDGSNTVQGKDYLVSEYEKNDKFVTDRNEYTYDCSTTASEGDTLDYILLSKLPHISSTATYLTKYTFEDTLSKGISYNADSIQIAFYPSNPETWANDINAHAPGSTTDNSKTYDADADGEDSRYASVNDLSQAAAVWNVSSDNKKVTVKAKETHDGVSKLTVEMTAAGLKEINTKYSDYYMVVYYQAKVNSDADVTLGDQGNPNDVKLTWERTSTGYWDTLEDKAIVFTYGFDLTKNFSDNNGNFDNVEFTLYNTTDGYYVVADTVETVGNDKVYYVTSKTDDESRATHLIPNNNGKVLVYGIEGDKYTLTEVKTDNKYQLLKDPVIIDIKTATQDIQSAIAGWDGMTFGDADAKNASVSGTNGEGRPNGKIDMVVGDVVSATATVDDKTVNLKELSGSNNAVVDLSVLNSKNWFFPQTGGLGFRLLPIIGILIAGCGIIIARKKNDEESEAQA